MALNGKCITLIIVPLLVGYVSASKGLCGNLLSSNGYTIPRGDIIIKYGEALNITCNLNMSMVAQYGENVSSRLYFTRNNEELPSEMIDVLNSTSIRLYLKDHPKGKQLNYYCWIRDEPTHKTALSTRHSGNKVVCFNVVFVGVAPQNITDFSCLSRNYENLTCSWTAKTNYVDTDYNLTYYLRVRASRFYYNCPKLKEEKINKDETRLSCYWDLYTDPQYRQSHGVFYFRLRMNNTFGTNENNFTFEHFKHVLPNPPENLTAVATSPHSIHLSWVIPLAMLNFQPGLRHRIWYQSDFNKNVWEYGGLITTYPEKNSGPVEFDLENLKYPHALYDIRVSMMSKVADENDEKMWSDNATITVRAQSKIPDHPPKTDIGSFESFYNRFTRDIYVYWQQLAEEEHNGQNFSYEVEVVNDPSLRPKDITKTYAYFSNVSFSTDYIINIRSRNDIGPSLEKSTVVVPTKGWQQPPSNFMKVEDFRNNDHIIYNLSWSPPKESLGSGKLPQSVTSYTLFWCGYHLERPHQCNGSLNWTTLPDSLLEYRTVLPATNHVYQFAISANYHNTSSGMQWAECTAFSATIGKIHSFWIKYVGSDYVEVAWQLDCSNRHLGPITGYIIYYCPIDKPSRPSCKGPEKNTTVPYDSKIQSAVVGGLESYVTYRFTISFIINHTTYSEPSDVCTNTTREAAPSTPQNIVVYDVTNSSISLRWMPPVKRNGVLKKYILYYSSQDKKQEMPVEPDKTDVIIQNLMSFEKYKITMEACTVDCSNKTDPIEVTTQMWMPSKIEDVQDYSTNETHRTFAWRRPVPARGKIDYYQVDYMQTFNSETKKFPYINITSNNFSIENCESGKYTKVQVIIRAVNIINGRHVAGPWSNPRDYYCQIRLFTPLIYILGGALAIFAVVMVSCCFKRAYVSIQDMKNIGVELPPGLHQKVNTTDTLKSMNKISADEVMPLNKMMKEGMRSSGDSSGLGSAHDSIASSEESTNHISPSDSGTEQPRSPSLSEDRKNSLRQRNKQANMKPSTINKGYVLPDAVPLANWSPKPSPATGGSYCVLGVDPTAQTETNSPYVSANDTTKLELPFPCDLSQPPPYVVTGDFIKSINTGYIPYTPPEPAEKNTGYVVAGITKDLVTPDLLQCDSPRATSVEEKPLYVKAAEALPNLKGVQFPWQQPPLETSLPKPGYVSVGDALPPKSIADITKGYVPHRQFEAKSLKED